MLGIRGLTVALLIFCGLPWACSETAVRVIMETELGNMEIEVYTADAPVSAANFLRHVDENLLQGASFYRVVRLDNQPDNDVKIEVIQGGLWPEESPLPAIPHETTKQTGRPHLDGVISMARLEPGSATSEIFICVGDQPELDFGGRRNPDGQGFAAFGQVVSGMEVVRRIQQLPADGQTLIEPVRIVAVRRR